MQPGSKSATERTPRGEDGAWHGLAAEDVMRGVVAQHAGLTGAEAARRLAAHGPNRLPEVQARGPFLRFLAHFHNVLIYVLFGAAVVTAALQHWVDTAVILAVVLANAAIGFIQEGKAEAAMAAMLGTEPVPLADGLLIVAVGAAFFAVIEIEKQIRLGLRGCGRMATG